MPEVDLVALPDLRPHIDERDERAHRSRRGRLGLVLVSHAHHRLHGARLQVKDEAVSLSLGPGDLRLDRDVRLATARDDHELLAREVRLDDTLDNRTVHYFHRKGLQVEKSELNIL